MWKSWGWIGPLELSRGPLLVPVPADADDPPALLTGNDGVGGTSPRFFSPDLIEDDEDLRLPSDLILLIVPPETLLRRRTLRLSRGISAGEVPPLVSVT